MAIASGYLHSAALLSNRTAVVWEELADSHTLAVGGNANTVYWEMCLDTHDGPQVLEIPPGVYGTFNDAWTRWVVDLGITGPDQGQGGKYLLLPPGYTGEIPDGYFVVRPLTFNVLALFRTLLVNGDPKPGIERCKAHLRCYPLEEAAHPGQMGFVNVSGKPFNMIGPADASVFFPYRLMNLGALYPWLPEWARGTLRIRGQPVTINYFHGRPQRAPARVTEAVEGAFPRGSRSGSPGTGSPRLRTGWRHWSG